MQHDHPRRQTAIAFRAFVGSRQFSSFVVWACLFLLFYSLGSGITCTNDGSHFALVKSLVEDGTARLGENAYLAGHDVAVYNGEHYADRNPGQALLAYVFIKALTPIRPYFRPIVMDPHYVPPVENTQILLAMVMLIPPLCGALLAVVLARIFRRLGLGHAAATILSVVLITSSLTLRYSTVLYSHILATLLVAASYLVFLDFFERRRLRHLFLGNLLLGTAVIVEHPTVLAYAPVVLALVVSARSHFLRPKAIAAFLAAGAIPAIPLLIYNYVNFDNPLSVAHFHHKTFEYFHDPGDIFRLGRFPLMFKQVFLYDRGFTSLLTSSPYYVLAFLSVVAFTTRRVRWDYRYSLAAGILLASIIPATTFSGDSGYDFDHRQMLFGLPFMMIFVATFVHWMIAGWRRAGSQLWIAAGLSFLALAARGWTTHFHHIRHAGQMPAPFTFINARAAFHNTLPLIVLGFAIAAATFLRERPHTWPGPSPTNRPAGPGA